MILTLVRSSCFVGRWHLQPDLIQELTLNPFGEKVSSFPSHSSTIWSIGIEVDAKNLILGQNLWVAFCFILPALLVWLD